MHMPAKRSGGLDIMRCHHTCPGPHRTPAASQVILTEEGSGTRAVFRCNLWLSDSRGDKSTSRDLYLSGQRPVFVCMPLPPVHKQSWLSFPIKARLAAQLTSKGSKHLGKCGHYTWVGTAVNACMAGFSL